MNKKSSFVLVAAILGACFFPETQQNQSANSELAPRVEKLEKRVQLLEQIVFSSAKLSTMQAERQVDEATIRLNHSQALHARGMINDLELQQDRFRLKESRKALELSIAESRQNELVGELEVLDAEQRLRQVEQRLNYTETLASRGYASQYTVDSIKRLLDAAKQRLANAKTKLEAARQLEAIKE